MKFTLSISQSMIDKVKEKAKNEGVSYSFIAETALISYFKTLDLSAELLQLVKREMKGTEKNAKNE